MRKDKSQQKSTPNSQSWLEELPKHFREEATKELRSLESEKAKTTANLKAETLKRKQAEAELAATKINLDLVMETQGKVRAKALSSMSKAAKRGSRGKATAVIIASDHHLGEIIESDQVNGLNEFNLKVAEARLRRLWDRSAFLIDFARNISDIEEVAMFFLGDFCSGIIHPELEQTNEIGVSEQIILVQESLATGVSHVRKETKLPIRVFCNSGNHGRAGHDRYIKAEYAHSLEAIAYRNVAKQFEKEPWVSFQIAKGYFNLCEIQGRLIRAHHGHALKYQGGILGPVVPISKKIASWNVATRPAWNDLAGHIHTRMSHPRFEQVGCLCGYSEFAIRCGIPYEAPSQTMLVVDRKWGKVASLPIFLEDTPLVPEAY